MDAIYRVPTIEMNIKIDDFGITDYREMWNRQKSLFHSLIDAKKEHRPIENEYILIGEHPAVYTLGFHGNAANMLHAEELKKRGIEFIHIERGGDITYHGPGQMIVYPILDLEYHHLGVKQYMSLLEDCVIKLLANYGINGEKVDGATGVWIDVGTPNERKICAMGIKCSKFVTMHGLALNVNTDLIAFSAINPCGFVDKGVSSIAQELSYPVNLETVKSQFLEILLTALQ